MGNHQLWSVRGWFLNVIFSLRAWRWSVIYSSGSLYSLVNMESIFGTRSSGLKTFQAGQSLTGILSSLSTVYWLTPMLLESLATIHPLFSLDTLINKGRYPDVWKCAQDCSDTVTFWYWYLVSRTMAKSSLLTEYILLLWSCHLLTPDLSKLSLFVDPSWFFLHPVSYSILW